MDEFTQYIVAQNRRGMAPVVEYNSPWRVPGSVKVPSAQEFAGKLDIHDRKHAAQSGRKAAKKAGAKKSGETADIGKPAPHQEQDSILAEWQGSTI